MTRYTVLILLLMTKIGFTQTQNFTAGVFECSDGATSLILNKDKTFAVSYFWKLHPIFASEWGFSDSGVWQRKGDTIVLNPHLEKKIYVEHDFNESIQQGDTNILLTVNIIKRHFDSNNVITSIDTTQAQRYDYWFNSAKENEMIRVSNQPTTRCAFAGRIPTEKITENRTVITIKPVGPLQKIYIGCYEYRDTKEFLIKNPESNRLTLNIYHNYYWGGFIRNKKVLIKNNNKLLYGHNKKGKYYHDIWWDHHSKLKRKETKAY